MRKKIILITTIILLTACMDNIKKDTIKRGSDKNITKENNITEEDSSKKRVEIFYTKEQQELKKELDIYFEQLKSLNTDGILDMTYPKLFIPINRTMFKHYIDSILTSPDIAIDSFNINIKSIGDINSYSNGKFASIEYISSIKLTFINPELYNNELSVRILNDLLQRKYGKENIIIDIENRNITINKNEKLLAIKEGDNSWKFIGDNVEYRRLYPQILPADILSNI